LSVANVGDILMRGYPAAALQGYIRRARRILLLARWLQADCQFGPPASSGQM